MSLEHAVPTEFKIAKTDFELFCSFFAEKSGIKFPESKRKYVENRLLERMALRNITDPKLFLRFLNFDPEGPIEINKLFDTLSINETFFFRNPEQLKMFSLLIRTEFLSTPRPGNRPLRIWCAGCSNGAEVYSLAMIIESFSLTFKPPWTYKILGTDISTKMLLTARRGAYRSDQIREVPADFKQIYKQFVLNQNDPVQIKDELKSRVDFTFHNMKAELPPPGTFDFIFCRNVLIYFDNESRLNTLKKFKTSLAPGGYLFLGGSESITYFDDNFLKISNDEAFAYKKVSS